MGAKGRGKGKEAKVVVGLTILTAEKEAKGLMVLTAEKEGKGSPVLTAAKEEKEEKDLTLTAEKGVKDLTEEKDLPMAKAAAVSTAGKGARGALVVGGKLFRDSNETATQKRCALKNA